MGTGASFSIESVGVITPAQVQNAQLQEDLLAFTGKLKQSGDRDSILSSFEHNGFAGTWIESFYDSELAITISDIDEGSTVDRSKYVAQISGSYKDGAGTISGLLLSTRKTAQGIWREGGNEGLFQFDLVEDGLVFCGPFFHEGNYMGTWWGRHTAVRHISSNSSTAKKGESQDKPEAAPSSEESASAQTLQREFLERERAAKEEQDKAAAAKKKALRDRVARRKKQSGRALPVAVHNTHHERVQIQAAMVEDLLFDPNLDEEGIVAKMQASADANLDKLSRIFNLASTPDEPLTIPRSRVWSHICSKVEDLSVDEDDVGVMIGKVFREDDEDGDGDGGGDGAAPRDTVEFVHFVHFLFHLANAFTLMHEGMLGSSHSLDKLLPVLTPLLA